MDDLSGGIDGIASVGTVLVHAEVVPSAVCELADAKTVPPVIQVIKGPRAVNVDACRATRNPGINAVMVPPRVTLHRHVCDGGETHDIARIHIETNLDASGDGTVLLVVDRLTGPPDLMPLA